jgi:dipeptidyl aminopeptidase/acylaminoacyl peptidase
LGQGEEGEGLAMSGAVIMHQNRLMRRFQDAEATGPKSAKSLMDIGCRKSWVFRRMDYHVNPDRIGVTGASAGGHLSLLVGLTDAAANLEGDSGSPHQSSRVQAVVNVFGPTDMAFCYEKSSVAWIFRLFMGGTPADAAERYKAASPINYVSADDPPVLTLHGDQDALVPVEQARKLDEKMKSVGAPHTLLIFEGQGHGFGGEYQQKAEKATWDFFDEHLKK